MTQPGLIVRRNPRSLRGCEPRRRFGRTALLCLTRLLLGGALLVCTSTLPATPAEGSEAKPFGISGFTMQTTEAGSANATVNEPYFFDQAAGHPVALTSKVAFATEEVGASHTLVPTRDPKEIIIDLPPGLLADPQAVPHCPPEQAERCPTDTQVGVFVLHASNTALLGPIINLTPSGNESAELGLETPLGMFLLMGRIVRTPEGYTSAIVASGLPTLGITSMEITLWGVPAAPVHTSLRGVSCIGSLSGGESNVGQGCQEPGVPDSEEPVAFLTTPSSCSRALTAVVWADSWEEPDHYVKAQSTLPAMSYCERLPFTPEISVRPETVAADRPVGINASIQVPQLGPEAVVQTPPLHAATLTLPLGVAINPSVADGLQSCNATGPAGINIPTGLSARGEPLEPGELGPGEEPGPSGEAQLAPGNCPKASIVGKVEASTPLLAHPIEGRVYMATPGCGGEGQKACTEQDAVDGNLYRLYIELGGNTPRDEGVLIKIEAAVTANPATGQLTVRISDMPQLPLSELSIQLYGGERGLLANPTTCGPARSTSELEPWSAPFTLNAAPSSYYEVTGCTSPRPFDPVFLSGSLHVAAGVFSPFTLTITRKDSEQNLAALQVRTPLGLSAMLSSVPLCADPQASAGECPEASRVGGSDVAAGVGSLPLYMPGNVYLTGPYDGAPYGLAIVTDAVAGPLNLGRLVIRARIDIDPQTAALEITSATLPQIVLGVPLHIQRISLDLDRPRFVVNPTDCNEQQITATIADAQGSIVTMTNPYGIADCASLAFKPKVEASTSAHTSLAGGASLDVRLTFPTGEPGTEANLARIKVALPRQLPTRLTSLQTSCPESTFDGDPSACPPASVVGIARARTPVLPGDLAGPVYLVAHGRNNLPSPIVVLQSEGVVLDLSGSTTIDKSGIGIVAFNSVPDVPMESLELFLPTGPHSLLAANASLCTPGKIRTVKRHITQREHGHTLHRTMVVRERLAATLPMRTELAAQNGTIRHQATQITVNGCTASQLATTRRPRAGS
ncbi:MAG TPA: hypothetical protein VIJ39_05910 [Solirubrobacteraceae bacterium]